jgi:hypothetical protein
MKTLFKRFRYSLVLFIIIGLWACDDHPIETQIKPSAPAPMNRQQQLKEEAQVDAQLAIQEQDFRLLAQRNKGTSIPGVDLELHQLSELEQQCGLLFMQHSGDEILQRSELILRQEQYVYALIYNNIILPACLVKTSQQPKK